MKEVVASGFFILNRVGERGKLDRRVGGRQEFILGGGTSGRSAHVSGGGYRPDTNEATLGVQYLNNRVAVSVAVMKRACVTE